MKPALASATPGKESANPANARRMFRRYWTLGVGSGAHVLVNGVIDRAREIAEIAGAPPAPAPQPAAPAEHLRAT